MGWTDRQHETTKTRDDRSQPSVEFKLADWWLDLFYRPPTPLIRPPAGSTRLPRKAGHLPSRHAIARNNEQQQQQPEHPATSLGGPTVCWPAREPYLHLSISLSLSLSARVRQQLMCCMCASLRSSDSSRRRQPLRLIDAGAVFHCRPPTTHPTPANRTVSRLAVGLSTWTQVSDWRCGVLILTNQTDACLAVYHLPVSALSVKVRFCFVASLLLYNQYTIK